MFYDFDKGLLNYIKTLNNYLYSFLKKEKFVTGTFLTFNENNGNVELYDMGHSYTYLLRKVGYLRPQKNTGSIPMGISDTLKPKAIKFNMKEKDLLIIFTDGIEEQRNPKGEYYDITRVLKTIKDHSNNNLIDIKNNLFRDVSKFKENQAQHDDMTLLLLRYNQ